MDQLVWEEKLKQLLHRSSGLGGKSTLGLKEIFLQDPPWELSMLSSLHQEKQDRVYLG